MTLLEKHRHDYKKLKKKELYEIIEEQLYINRKKIDKRIYRPLYSKRNNARRALRKFWSERNTDIIKRMRIKNHLKVLKQIRDEGDL